MSNPRHAVATFALAALVATAVGLTGFGLDAGGDRRPPVTQTVAGGTSSADVWNSTGSSYHPPTGPA
ncbi:hypothetical protein ACIBK8_08905 [Streptomyces sp. NPDC050161]|uniref:hypothetical protein n=1 Tax=Streptomyces sp. NPDC050161 TaxID=3365604 RepID=UPI0037BD9219